MNNATETDIARLAREGICKCLGKFNTVSNGAWTLTGLKVFTAPLPQALRAYCAGHKAPDAVRVTVKGAPAISTLLLFGRADAEHINLCFVKEKLYVSFGPDRESVTLLEIGNILLNALANSLLKAFQKSAIPSVPERVPAEPAAAAPAGADAGGTYRMVSAELSI
ncbi:MAG: hypothetical protein NDI60_05565, partial [Elusimicrobiales bacterium]|nr:hypothetical protein [Elusimicrobiales bacterium]